MSPMSFLLWTPPFPFGYSAFSQLYLLSPLSLLPGGTFFGSARCANRYSHLARFFLDTLTLVFLYRNRADGLVTSPEPRSTVFFCVIGGQVDVLPSSWRLTIGVCHLEEDPI